MLYLLPETAETRAHQRRVCEGVDRKRRYATPKKHYIYETRTLQAASLRKPHRQQLQTSTLVAQWHAFHAVDQSPPAIGLELGVLDPLLRPLLMCPRDAPDHALEEDDLVSHALFDEDAARVLVDDRLLVLQENKVLVNMSPFVFVKADILSSPD